MTGILTAARCSHAAATSPPKRPCSFAHRGQALHLAAAVAADGVARQDLAPALLGNGNGDGGGGGAGIAAGCYADAALLGRWAAALLDG